MSSAARPAVNPVLATTARCLNSIFARHLSATFTDAANTMSNGVAGGVPASGSTELVIPPKSAFEAPGASVPPVWISHEAIDRELTDNADIYSKAALPPDWAQTYHYTVPSDASDEDKDRLCQYVFVLDALNFCFWPLSGYEYEHLAGSLKAVLDSDPTAFSAESLASVDSATLQKWLHPPAHFPLISTPLCASPDAQRDPATGSVPIPLLAARTRLINELGSVLAARWGGKAANLVRAAKGSAAELLRLVTAELPGFRDQAQWGGDQVFFYKRAQILIGDLWGAFQGQGIGSFTDMEYLTCFADYRIPQLFIARGLLVLSPELQKSVDTLGEVPAGSEAEVALRCATVQCVELIKGKLKAKGGELEAFQLDWLLWEAGERMMKEGTIPPHHRTITTFY